MVMVVLFINCKIYFLVVYGLDIGLNSLVDICFLKYLIMKELGGKLLILL